MFLIAATSAMAQSVTGVTQRVTTGRITSSEDNSPMPGVNVVIKGTTNGTVTDTDGSYQIAGANANDVIIFSFVGFASKEVPVGALSKLDIVLTPDTKQLNEVVVTALGIEKDATKVGYSQQKVQGSDLIKAREPNPMNSLVGKVAGLTVGASSEMLGRPQMVLRGENNLLIVIDGVPVVSDTWNIPADDIESYTVLKGPNAAALYGSRGQNGAIVITTKKGTRDKRGFAVDFNSSTMVDKGFLTIPKVQDEYGPGEYNAYKFGNDVYGQQGGWNQNDYDVWGPRFNGQLISQYDSPVDPTTGIRQGTPWVARGKNNLQRFVQSGILSTNNLALSTSNDKYDLRVSYSHSYQRGIVPTTQLNIDNVNITSGYNITPKLRIESNINYNRQYTPNFPDVNYGPNSMIYNIDIWGGSDWDINDLKNYWLPGQVGVMQRTYEYYRYNNPWFLAKEWTRGHYKTDIYGYLAVKYTINSWLKAAIRTQITSWDLFRNEKFPYGATVYGREQRQGDYREDRRSLFENNTDVLLTINKNITPNINISGVIGGNLRTYNFNSMYGTTNYLNVPQVYNFANSKNPVSIYNFTAPMQVGSGYYSFDFSYKHFVTLSTTGRLDKYSTFYSGYNAGFYPSVSASTIISDYVKMPSIISFLKVRASYANVKNAFTQATIGPAWNIAGLGNPAQSNTGNPLSYGSNYTSVYDGPVYNSNTYTITKPYNNIGAAYYTTVQASSTLKPSSTSSLEGGLDIKVLENRLGLSVTYFDAIKGPGIVTSQWSESSGFTGGTINGIKTEKKGWEITLSGTPVKSGSFSWNTTVNYSTYVERYKEFYNGLTALNGSYLTGVYANSSSLATYKIGDRIDNLYGYKFFRSPDGQIIHDAGGLALQDNKKVQVLGHTNPDFVWSFINTFSYKNFSFNFQLDGRVGGVGVDYVYRKLLQGGREISTVQGAYGDARLAEFNQNPNNDPKNIPKTYVGDGVVASGPLELDANGHPTNLDQLTYTQNTVKTSLQDYLNRETSFDERTVMNFTFMKLRQVTLTYNLSPSFLQKSGIRQASISLVGRNLLYFAKRTDIDLDQFIGTNLGSQILQSPTLRRYGININLTF
jgi:TonB-linked SusC/RagA family outer membrane protein